VKSISTNNVDDLGSNPSVEDTHHEAILEPPPVKPLTVEVSTTGSVFIFCNKGLSLKLLLKGEITVLQ
jgi:hypothetical protein